MFITGHFAGLPEFLDEFRREELEELIAELAAAPTGDAAGAAPAGYGPPCHTEQRFTEPNAKAIVEAGTGDIAFASGMGSAAKLPTLAWASIHAQP